MNTVTLSRDAEVILQAHFQFGNKGTELSFANEHSRIHERAQKALKELVEANFLSYERRGKKLEVFTLSVERNELPFGKRMTIADDFPITDKDRAFTPTFEASKVNV